MIKLIVIICVVFFIGYCTCNCKHKEDELLTVLGVFRHGDKTPKSEYFNVYPNNPWSNPKLWNHSDLGSVTNTGKMSMYNRGKWLRERYRKFLPEKYSDKNIRILASDSDRVLISAQLLLAGLYPPKGTDLWNHELIWQPIPIHVLPDYNDTEVAQNVPCSRFSKLVNMQLGKLPEFEDAKYLSKYIGKELTSLEEIYRLYKLLKIVEENDMVLPGWAKTAMPQLKQLNDFFSKMYSVTPEMQKFTAGPLLNTLINHFDSVLNKSETAPKMLLFAGHSRTISNLLMTLNAYKEQPPYTSILLFELKKNCNGSPFVDVYYKTSELNDPEEILKNVQYNVFKEEIKPIAIDPYTWRKECRTGFIFRE